jgi:hypothetical protein
MPIICYYRIRSLKHIVYIFLSYIKKYKKTRTNVIFVYNYKEIMVIINGKKFKIYDLDSIHTFKDRLASELSTLPEYLYFPDGLTYTDLKKDKINVENILDEIIKSAGKNESVLDLINSIKNKLSKINIGDKIVAVWLGYNKKLEENVNKMGDTILNAISKDLIKNRVYLTHTQFMREWNDRNRNKKFLQHSITTRKEKSSYTIKLFEEYYSIEESSVSTDFKIEYIQFMLTLNLVDISLLELFNEAILTDSVPFITTHNFFKILTNYTPPDEWASSDDINILKDMNKMILKVMNKKFISTSSKASNYIDTIVSINQISNNINAEITIKTDKGNVSRDVFIERFIGVFKNIDINVTETKESKVVGTFYFPGLTLDKYIFADMVMNDNVFKLMLNMDDHEKATKNKTGIYIHFDHPTTGYITATVTQMKMKKNDILMKDEDPEFFPVGEPYIRVRISKSDNSQSVENFKDIMGKLFVRYDEKYNEIRDFYKEYIPTFGDIEIEDVEDIGTNIKLSEEVPELFGVKGYSTNCGVDRTPSIVSEDEAKKIEEEGKNVIKFPRDNSGDDSENQLYYTCKHVKHKHIGLQENKLKNSDVYPYVPCCFERDQRNKPAFQHYYQGKEQKLMGKKQHNIISTDKILKHDQYGTLPSNIENLFTIIDPDPKMVYVRRGVGISEKRNVNSFLNVVMEALNDETDIITIDDEDELESELIDQRNKLATKKLVSSCRQELYDMTTDEIIKILKDGNVYLNPRWFLHLLEVRFECNIFLFTKNTMNGEMTLPRHLQAYYKNRNKNRCIYIFEHMGSKSDDTIKYPWPQCELIVKYNELTGKTQGLFTHKEATNIRNVHSRLRQSYALDKNINETYIPIDSLKIKSQCIDSYGKTRQLNIMFDEHRVSLITSPIQPLKARETKDFKIYTVPIDIAMKLVDSLYIKITSQITIGTVVKEINGVLGNVNISIPIKDGKIIKGIPEKQYELNVVYDQTSVLDQYNKNKKLARYIVEYTLWLFSRYIYESGDDYKMDDISFFAKNRFIVDPAFIYDNVSKNFTDDCSFLKDGQIVVHSEETIKRLIYVLRLNLHMDRNGILQYHKQKYMKNYYVDLSDFTTHNHQVILFGEESVEKWISEYNMNYFLFDSVQIGINTPYFFKNKLVDDVVYMAQNTTSLEKANDIAITWEIDGYNTGINAKEASPVSFTLYSYTNSTSIKRINIKGKPFSGNIKIIGYKIDNKPFYTVLLTLS